MAKKNKKKQQNVDLFGNPLNDAMQKFDERPILLLTSESKSIKDCFETLSCRYNKTQIEKMANNLKKTLKHFRVRDKAMPDAPIKRMEKFFTNPYLKEDYTWAVAIVMGDDDNFKVYFDTIPEYIKKVWDICYRKLYVNGNELNDITGKNLIVKKSGFYSYSYTTNDDYLCDFIISNHYYHYLKDMQPYVYMPSILWKLYNRNIADKRVHPLDELKDDGNLLFYSNEASIGEQLLMLKQMQGQGMLEFGAKKMAQTTIKKAAQQIGLKEFYSEAKNKDLNLLAAQQMIPSLASYALSATNKNFNEYWDVISLILDTSNVDAVAMQWVSHLKAVKREDLLHYSHLNTALENIRNGLGLITTNQWYSVTDFENVRKYMNDVSPDDIEVVNARFVYDEKMTLASSGRRIRVDEIYENFTVPVMKGFLFMLATYGVLEIAYRTPSPTEPIFGGLEYIRLTKLGEYVFGHAEEYKAAGIHTTTEYFEIDTERLLIRAIDIDGKNPYEAMLKNVAVPIGARRYKVTAEAFMKGCEDMDDIERKWDFIKQNICSEPSAVWQDFYNDRKRHCHPLMNTGIGYSVKKILPGDTELMRILATDKFIREHIIRAEKNHILIETKMMEKVKERLRVYGYIL